MLRSSPVRHIASLTSSCILNSIAEQNDLRFIETSALEASNVEQAFSQILTSASSSAFPYFTESLNEFLLSGIFKIVAQKQLENTDEDREYKAQQTKKLDVSVPPTEGKQGGCC